jgi:hypothetical protein
VLDGILDLGLGDAVAGPADLALPGPLQG